MIAPKTGTGSEIFDQVIEHIQVIVDHAISKAPSSQAEIKALDGKSLAIHTPILNICLRANWSHNETGRIELLGEPSSPPDVVLAATPIMLLRLVLADDKQEILRSSGVSVSGSTDDLEQWHKLFHTLDIDWEAVLAERTGDIPAHLIGKNLRAGAKWGKKVNASLLANIEEYLHEEVRLLPTASELQYHFSQVDNLKLAADRLDARLSRLEKK
ncbi:MAG: hypothetical protein CSA50_01470 [Gammaproteobacteria bacterium]|nr:MAG: hypothetical protein CSA50_01470 [Gammaproteobacteria bacterium]